MKIGIDLSLACYKTPRGIGVFEKKIGLPGQDYIKSNQIYIFGVGKKPLWIPIAVKYINLYTTNPIIREQILIPFFVFWYRIKKLHLFANVIPFLLVKSFCKIFITIHDVSYKYSRDYMNIHQKQNTFKRKIGLAYQSIFFNLSCKYSSKIFTVSDWSKNEINNQTSFMHNEKIYIIPNVCSEDFISKPKAKWSDRNNRILLVTGAHPQKNIIFFLDCFLELSKSYEIDFKVDMIGVKKIDLEDKYSKLDKIEFHGMVSQERLIQFYDNSKLLVMPSLFESFAIPLIEARNRGLWILSSDGGAAPEIISDFAIFLTQKIRRNFQKNCYSFC